MEGRFPCASLSLVLEHTGNFLFCFHMNKPLGSKSDLYQLKISLLISTKCSFELLISPFYKLRSKLSKYYLVIYSEIQYTNKHCYSDFNPEKFSRLKDG